MREATHSGTGSADGESLRPSARIARTGEVLDLLRRGEASTTAELAAAMGVVRSTVTERLELLQKHDLIVQVGETRPSRGRPAGILDFNRRAGVTLSAQVGMSGTMVAVTDLGGNVLFNNQVDLDVGKGPAALFSLLEREFANGLAEVGDLGERVFGVGIGLPGDLEIASANGGGAAPPPDWRTFGLSEQLEAAFGAPVFVDRDVNFMALGEHRTTWPQAKILLCLKVGTVIACGVVIGGEVIRGATGLSGEIGHSKVPGADAPCPCGSRGCLNTVVGGPALASRLAAEGYATHTARDVAELANQGVPAAGQAVRDAGRLIGETLGPVINLFNPDVLTAWGYLVDTGDQFLAGMHEAIYQAALPSSARAISLERSQLGDDAGVRGAALSVIEMALKPVQIDRFIAAHSGS